MEGDDCDGEVGVHGECWKCVYTNEHKGNKMNTKETKCTQRKQNVQNILHNKRYKKVCDKCSVVQIVLCMVLQETISECTLPVWPKCVPQDEQYQKSDTYTKDTYINRYIFLVDSVVCYIYTKCEWITVWSNKCHLRLLQLTISSLATCVRNARYVLLGWLHGEYLLRINEFNTQTSNKTQKIFL